MRKLLAITVLPLLMTACEHDGKVEIKTVEVLKPVPVYCVEREDIPENPPKVGDQLTGSAQTDLDIVSLSLIDVRKALNVALAMLEGCVDPNEE